MIAWFQNHETILWWLGTASAMLFIVTLVMVPLLVCRIPTDYFAHEKQPLVIQHGSSAFWPMLLLIIKSVVGFFLIFIGILMLVLPGQGVITILVGMSFLRFPGKYKLEKRLVQQRLVLQSVNWLRQRKGHPPLDLG